MAIHTMRPQDIVILLKILIYGEKPWYNKDIARDLFLSASEVSNSLERSTVSGLIDSDKKKVRVQSLLEFLVHGIKYVFPERPAGFSKGIPTAHSHPFMQKHFAAETQFVWPDARGDHRGLSVQPLYPTVIEAAKHDEILYLILGLVDVLRLGKAREKKVAIAELEKLLMSES